MRRSSPSIRIYLQNNWKGNREAGMKYHDLWCFAELVDLEAAEAHMQGGMAWLNYTLATSDRIEHALSRLGAEFALQQTGDYTMFEALLSSRPPGHEHVLPDWAITAARNQSKIEHQQAAWLKGDTPVDDDGVGGGAARRRNRKPQAKAQQGANNQGGKGGGGKGGAQGGGPAKP